MNAFTIFIAAMLNIVVRLETMVVLMKKRFQVRAQVNRRSEEVKTRFPMQIESGEVVLRERRLSPDRRHPVLQTQELKISSEVFAELFDVYSQQG